MRIEQLEYLMMISKCASLTEASERLFITQQSLGKAIRDLEEELGVTLLLRNNRGCALTREGRETVQMAKEILEKISQLQNHFVKEEEKLEGKLTILCSPILFSDELAIALEAFSNQYSEVDVTAMERDSFQMLELHEQLLQQEEAIVISILHQPQEKTVRLKFPANLQFHPVYKTQWLACMNPQNRLARQTRITTEALLKEKIIVSSPNYPGLGLDAGLLSCYGKPQIKRIVSSQTLFYKVLREVEDCIGIIPDVLLHDKQIAVPKELACCPTEPPIYSTAGYVIDKKQSNQVIAQKFIQYFEAAVEKTAIQSKG